MRTFPLVALFLWTSAAFAQNAVGINSHVPTPDMLDLAEESGVGWIRVDANWWQLEPSRGAYRWEVLDPGVQGAIDRGINVYVTLAYTPEWVPKVDRARSDTYTGNDEPVGSTEWVSFVEAAVRHYRAMGVTHFGLWNEPNLDGFWDGSIDAYVDKIALPGAAAVRRVCSDCRTLGPDLAHVGDVDEALDRVMARGASAFDIIAHHLYGGWTELGHTVFDGDSFLNALEMRRFAFTRASMKEILDRHGWTGEVWITETGYRMNPVDSSREATDQATYVRRVLEEQLARDWWTNSFFYELVDCGIDLPGCGIDGYGLTRPTRGHPRTEMDYERKPAFTTLRDFIDAHPEIGGAGTERLACVNGVDDDGDGRTDMDDRGCDGEGDGDEVDPPREQIQAVYLSPTVDGDLSDWTGVAWVDATRWVGDGDRDELSARASAAWSEGVLYLAIEVTDDVHVNDRSLDSLWASDSVQVAFDIDRDYGDGYDGNDQELDLALVSGTAVAHRNHGSGSDGWDVAIVRSGERTLYEVALPAAVLDGRVDTDRRFGFSWLVNEDDGAGRAGWLEWTRGIGAEKAPYWFGEIVLLAADTPPTDAGPGMDAGPTPGSDAGTPMDPDAGTMLPDGGTMPGPGDPGGSGGGCSVAGSTPVSWLMLGMLSVLRRRRRSLLGSDSRGRKEEKQDEAKNAR